MKTLKTYVSFFEALKLSDYKSALSKVSMPNETSAEVLRWAMGKLSKITGMTKSRNGHRLYLPLKGGGKAASISPDFEKAIQELMSDKGYSEPDIILGTIKEPVHGRAVKFSKAFRDLSDQKLAASALADYSESPYLYGKKGQNMLVFTAHPYDKIGASTGRDWNSCATFNGRFISPTLVNLVKGTNILVYWTDIGDTNLNAPKGRAVLSVYKSSTDREEKLYIWPENKVYGNFPVLAMDFLQDALVEIFPDVTDFLSANRSFASDYDEVLGGGKWIIKRDSFVLKGPFDWASASDRLRAYVSAKYNIKFNEKGEVFTSELKFPLQGEPYFSEKMPFVIGQADFIKFINCNITDYSKFSPTFSGALEISGNKKLVDLDTFDCPGATMLSLYDVPALSKIGLPRKTLRQLYVADAPNLDISQDGSFDRLELYKFAQSTPVLRDPFPALAPRLRTLVIDIKDWDGFFEVEFAKGSIKDRFPELDKLELDDSHGQLTHVPDYFLMGKISVTGTQSPFRRLARDLYDSPFSYVIDAVANSGAVTKDAIYWDKLPKKITDDCVLIERPVSGVFHERKII